MDQLPLWLAYLQAFADVAWKGASAALVLLASPKVISSLKAYTEVRTAQLKAERDIERQRREAIEADFERLQKVIPLAAQGASMLKEQLEQVTAAYSSLQLSKGRQSPALDTLLLPEITRLMNIAISIEIARNNALAGQRMARDLGMPLAELPPIDPSTQAGRTALAAAMLAILPEVGLKDSPERLLGAIESLSNLAQENKDLPQVVGREIAKNVSLVAILRDCVSNGSPMPVSSKYILPFA